MSDTTSFLNESMETLVQPEDLKVLLDTQKNLTHLEDIGKEILL